MKYVKRCLVLLLALMMTMALVQPAPTAAKYTTESKKTVDITLDTMQETYTIKNVMQQGNFSTLETVHEDPDGYRVNTNKEDAGTGGMAKVGYYKDNSDFTHPSYYRQVWTLNGTLQVEDTDVASGGTHNIWIYADLNTDTERATAGHLYYLRTRYLIVSLGGAKGISFRIADTNGNVDPSRYGVESFSAEENKWYYGQTILEAPNPINVTATGNNAAKNLAGCLRIGGDNSGKADGSVFQYKISHIMLVDLTDTFGAGNEPPLWWCNKYIPWVDETTTETKTVKWFPEDSKSRLDTAFHDGTLGYYYENGEYRYFRDANQYRANDGTVASNGSITVGGMEHINSTTLNNP